MHALGRAEADGLLGEAAVNSIPQAAGRPFGVLFEVSLCQFDIK